MSASINPRVPQGSLNRLLGSLTFPDNTAYNITAEFLGSEGISANFGGPVTTMLGTLTGAVNSQEPYMLVPIAVHLIRAQALGNSFKKLIETNANLGAGVLRVDASVMAAYDFDNCNVTELRPMAITGRDAGFMLSITGIWYINNSLWG